MTLPGLLDPAFGASGHAVVPVVSPPLPATAQFPEAFEDATVVGAGGQVDLVGRVFPVKSGGSSVTTTIAQYLVVSQLKADGTVDTSFGNNGQATVAITTGSGVTTSTGFSFNLFGAFAEAGGGLVAVGDYSDSVNDTNVTETVAFAVRLNADGSVDSSYGTGGIATFEITNADGSPTQGVSVTKAALQPDGKVVVAGGDYGGDLFAARLDADGSTDMAFGKSGIAAIPAIGSIQENTFVDLAIQPDGKIVLSGVEATGFGPFRPGEGPPILTYGGFAVRLDADGSRDTAFGGASGGGVAAFPVLPNGPVVVQASGDIVLAGSNLIRLRPDGTPDTSFGPQGTSAAVLPLAASTAVTQADGKILLVGRTPVGSLFGSGRVAVERLDTDLTPDVTFGNTATPGLSIFSTLPDTVVSPALGPDGSLVLGQTNEALPDPTLSFGAARVSTSGTPTATDYTEQPGAVDPSYGDLPLATGTIGLNALEVAETTAGFTPGTVTLTASAVGTDGKIVVAGTVRETSTTGVYTKDNTFLVFARFNPDGTLDDTFNATGRLHVPKYDGVSSLAFGPAGQIYAAVGGGDPVVSPPTLTGFTVLALTYDGQVDTYGFGTAGFANFQPTGSTNSTSNPSTALDSILVQPDGKIVLAGTAERSATAGVPTAFAVARLDADGALDTTFAGTGSELIPFPIGQTEDVTFGGLALQADGKIVLAGSAAHAVQFTAGNNGAELSDGVAVRLDANGALDTTFGPSGTGKVILPDGTSAASATTNDQVNGVGIQPGGKIVILGTFATTPSTLIRLDADGSPDATFGAGGSVKAPISTTSLLVDVSGDLVLSGLYASNLNSGTSYSPAVARLGVDGAADPTFGTDGLVLAHTNGFGLVTAALEPDGNIILAGTTFDSSDVTEFATVRILGHAAQIPFPTAPLPTPAPPSIPFYAPVTTTPPPPTPTPANKQAPDDFDGDGKSDLTVYLSSLGEFAYRPSGGGADVLVPFGVPGAGQTLPAIGDYTGAGHAEIAAYIPSQGLYAYRPADGGPDVVEPFGIAGAGQSIPAVGDYTGSGKDDVAIYLPSLGAFAIRPAGGGADRIIAFGLGGLGGSIPAPGDYDGDGKTDLAVYLPSLGEFAYRPSSGGSDVIVPFGLAGSGRTLPAPGDYDGSGKTEIAAYLPTLGIFAYRPAGGGADVVQAFGTAGDGTIPVVGDFSGSGYDDVAIYDPNYAAFAYRPSSGADVITVFGQASLTSSVPAAALPTASTPATVAAMAVRTIGARSVPSGPVVSASSARRATRTVVAEAPSSAADLGV